MKLQTEIQVLDKDIEPKIKNWINNHLFKAVKLGYNRFPRLTSYIVEHLKSNTFIVGSPDLFEDPDKLIVKRNPILWTPNVPENVTLYCKLSDQIWNTFYDMYRKAYSKINDLHELQITIIPHEITKRQSYYIVYNVFPKDKTQTDIKPIIGLGFFLGFMQAVMYANNDRPDITYLSISFDFQDIIYNRHIDYDKVVSKVLRQIFKPCNEIMDSINITFESVYLSHNFDESKSGIIELDRHLIVGYEIPSKNIWKLDHVNLSNLFKLLIDC